MKQFARAGLVALICATALPAAAQQWEASSDPTPMASTFDDISQVGFLCEEGRLVFKFLVLPGQLNPAVSGLPRVDVVFAIDPDAQGNRQNFWVDIAPRLTDNGGTMFAFVGEVAVQWARLAMQANQYVIVGLSPDADAAQSTIYNAATYSAKGSTASIRAVVNSCG
jgi:hypothetical protein